MSLKEVIPNSFSSLLSLFGISLQGQKDNSFVLHGDVLPVVVVGSTTQLQAVGTGQVLDVPFTVGSVAAPVAGTLLADTGAQAEGNYGVKITISKRQGNFTGDFIIARRNAANAADVWTIESSIKDGNDTLVLDFSARLLANERIRVVELANGGYTVKVNIWILRLS